VRRHEGPVFYFIYNTDNYYHFIYDTLPYLISYLELKKNIPDLRLLMNYPNSQSQTFYKFVLEFLALFNVKQDSLVLADMQTHYADVYLSSSYTHDHDSNAAPRREIHALYQNLARNGAPDMPADAPRRVYISRRTWLHGDFSNIGTNYTTRRRLENEDTLMELLARYGFTEVFTENLSTLEKLNLFSHAEVVVGALGGGVCNVLFSPPETKLLCLVSPTFLEVNARFAYSLNQVQLTWFDQATHVEPGRFKRFMRVSCPSQSIVGEITEVHSDSLTVAYTNEKVAGWNAQNTFLSATLPMAACEPLDAGLNSAWRIDLDAFEETLQSVL
jgi:capsular polysaccharide biosynthesis protein